MTNSLRKSVGTGGSGETEAGWLAIEDLAHVVVTSEDPDAPIEAALIEGAGSRWRAAAPGAQSIRIRFDRPQDIHLIHVVFEETEHARVQEFSLEWSNDDGRTFQPIIRQQFSFSPSGATREAESYRVNLSASTELRLHVVPEISGGSHVATLTRLRIR
ncbi:MAG: carbohydrate-binding protein [Acidobacteria bacterium]|nr:carbohydrate-binding protein [Acidobacteriota bacterium]MBA3888792.1 carbohydrate-binding protein [Acidobacteriota bacterium]